MRRLLYLTLMISVVLSACGTAAPAPKDAPPAAAPTQVAALTPAAPPATSTSGPAASPTQIAVESAPTSAPVIKTEFTPTDPTTVNLALGRPQFVEFFAFS